MRSSGLGASCRCFVSRADKRERIAAPEQIVDDQCHDQHQQGIEPNRFEHEGKVAGDQVPADQRPELGEWVMGRGEQQLRRSAHGSDHDMQPTALQKLAADQADGQRGEKGAQDGAQFLAYAQGVDSAISQGKNLVRVITCLSCPVGAYYLKQYLAVVSTAAHLQAE